MWDTRSHLRSYHRIWNQIWLYIFAGLTPWNKSDLFCIFDGILLSPVLIVLHCRVMLYCTVSFCRVLRCLRCFAYAFLGMLQYTYKYIYIYLYAQRLGIVPGYTVLHKILVCIVSSMLGFGGANMKQHNAVRWSTSHFLFTVMKFFSDQRPKGLLTVTYSWQDWKEMPVDLSSDFLHHTARGKSPSLDSTVA